MLNVHCSNSYVIVYCNRLVPTLSTKGSLSLQYGEGGNIIATCYSDLPLSSIVWWYNHTTSTDLCKFDNSCTTASPFVNSTYNVSSDGTIHQLILSVDRALHGVYSCGIYPVSGSNTVQLQNFTFYGKLRGRFIMSWKG